MGNLVMKLRFSLRTVIALLTIAALFGHWRSRPDRLAATYSQHIENYDFAADALLTDRLSQKLYQLRVNSRWIDVNLNIQQPGVRDWFIGRRRGWIVVRIGTGGLGCADAEGPVLVTGDGVMIPELSFQREFSGATLIQYGRNPLERG